MADVLTDAYARKANPVSALYTALLGAALSGSGIENAPVSHCPHTFDKFTTDKAKKNGKQAEGIAEGVDEGHSTSNKATEGASKSEEIKGAVEAVIMTDLKDSKTEGDDLVNTEEPLTPEHTRAKGGNRKRQASMIEGATPRTPKKRASAKSKASAIKSGGTDEVDTPKTPKTSPKVGDEVIMDTTSPSIRKRSSPKVTPVTGRAISTSWDDANPEDKMLVQMRDRGETWGTIREAWKGVTGQDTARSTLPNRYQRLKCNMMEFDEADVRHLLSFIFITSPLILHLTSQH